MDAFKLLNYLNGCTSHFHKGVYKTVHLTNSYIIRNLNRFPSNNFIKIINSLKCNQDINYFI